MSLSKRLTTVVEAVTRGHRVADIGTDHAFVPIALVEEGISPSAIAADINKGPLERARDHIRSRGLSDRILTRLGDGLDPVSPEEVDTVICTGMGGALMERLLLSHPEFFREGKEFILSPQSECFRIRKLLRACHYRIDREWFFEEEGKYYLVIKAVPAGEEDSSETVDQDLLDIYDNYGRYLIREGNAVLKCYLGDRLKEKYKIAAGLKKGPDKENTRARIGQLEAEADQIEKTLSLLHAGTESGERMKYCMECGTKLQEKYLEHEGMIPYCDQCKTYRFPVFSTAVSMEVLNPSRDKVLLIKQYGKDRYILVAGYVNKGENAEDTVVREVMEEVGLKVTSLHFEKSEYFAPSNTLMLNFSCVVESEDLSHISQEEIDSCCWFPLAEARERIAQGSLASKFLNRYLYSRQIT